MAEYADVMQALRNADAAGDTEAARRLAAIANSMRVAPTSDAKPTARPSSILERIGSGMADPIHGGAQTLTHILPQGIVEAGNKLNNKLADLGLPIGKIPEGPTVTDLVTGKAKQGGLDQMISEREAEYEARRAAAGSTGFDFARLFGNVISPANAAISRFIPGAGASLGARVAGGAAGGVALSALNPVAGGDYWTEKAKQAALGGALGAASPLVGEGISRVISPKVNKVANELLNEGVALTPGQTLGGKFKTVEDALTSIPFAGDTIKEAQKRSVASFNKTAINRSLAPIGEKLPESVAAGNDALEYAANKLSNAYDDLLPKIHGELDNEFKKDLLRFVSNKGDLPSPQYGQLRRILNNDVVGRFSGKGQTASGEALKEIDSRLGGMIRDFGRSENADVRRLSEVLKDVQSSVGKMVYRVNGSQKDALDAIDRGYANLLRVQTAGARIGAKEGIFTPDQLLSAVRQMDPSKGKRAFAQGNALMQDLATAGGNAMRGSVPDSGTPLRQMMANPIYAALGLGGSIPMSMFYSAPGVKLADLALTARPQSAPAIANSVRNYLPLLTPGVVAGANVGNQ